MASQSVEEYMEAIYRLGGDTGVVATCKLAGQLGVSPPSVTTMLRRLSRDGLIEHIRYRGINLTDRGRDLAAAMVRRHRLSERLLVDMIGLSVDEVHDTACKLEHVLTGELEEKVYLALGRPDSCPHGQPISSSRESSPSPETKD